MYTQRDQGLAQKTEVEDLIEVVEVLIEEVEVRIGELLSNKMIKN